MKINKLGLSRTKLSQIRIEAPLNENYSADEFRTINEKVQTDRKNVVSILFYQIDAFIRLMNILLEIHFVKEIDFIL